MRNCAYTCGHLQQAKEALCKDRCHSSKHLYSPRSRRGAHVFRRPCGPANGHCQPCLPHARHAPQIVTLQWVLRSTHPGHTPRGTRGPRSIRGPAPECTGPCPTCFKSQPKVTPKLSIQYIRLSALTQLSRPTLSAFRTSHLHRPHPLRKNPLTFLSIFDSPRRQLAISHHHCFVFHPPARSLRRRTMGADFSLMRDTTPPAPRRRLARAYRRQLYIKQSTRMLEYPPDSTRANTLANRSSTPVAKHVALARLAERLSNMGKRRRERVIEQLHIPQDMLREVQRYTPSNSFGSTADDNEWMSSDEAERRTPESASVCSDEGDEIDSELSASPTSSSGKRRRKIVSFAKYAELRLFRE